MLSINALGHDAFFGFNFEHVHRVVLTLLASIGCFGVRSVSVNALLNDAIAGLGIKRRNRTMRTNFAPVRRLRIGTVCLDTNPHHTTIGSGIEALDGQHMARNGIHSLQVYVC